jgi:hypothetical protein
MESNKGILNSQLLHPSPRRAATIDLTSINITRALVIHFRSRSSTTSCNCSLRPFRCPLSCPSLPVLCLFGCPLGWVVGCPQELPLLTPNRTSMARSRPTYSHHPHIPHHHFCSGALMRLGFLTQLPPPLSSLYLYSNHASQESF